jgi:hypothetical protein
LFTLHNDECEREKIASYRIMANDSGFFDNPALLETLTIRGRVAYYLAVTESIFAAIPLDDEGRNYAREAIIDALRISTALV